MSGSWVNNLRVLLLNFGLFMFFPLFVSFVSLDLLGILVRGKIGV